MCNTICAKDFSPYFKTSKNGIARVCNGRIHIRGDDTRIGFTAHLRTALQLRWIRVYRDDEHLPKGEVIWTELVKAIESSRIAVVVFTRNYATSKWCMDELVKILECKSEFRQKVPPIFYHVRPSEVGEQSGDFVQGNLNGDGEMVNIWRTALRKAVKLLSWHLKRDW